MPTPRPVLICAAWSSRRRTSWPGSTRAFSQMATKLPRRPRRPGHGGPEGDCREGDTRAPGLHHESTGHALPRRGLNPAVDWANKLVDAAELNPDRCEG